jgi:alkylated DNA nucleotide flippase Atl1
MAIMETAVRTPMHIFALPQQLVVPLFQRPYVWDEQNQWAPLWHDVRRLIEARRREPFGQVTHFLGAIVVQSQEMQLGHLPGSNIIDGQQRLTTLQLLMDAAAGVLKEADLDTLAGQLETLTHNQANFLKPGDSPLKVRHTNKDRAAFDEVMDAEPPVDHDSLKHAGSLVTRAHAYFTRAVSEWLGDPASDGFSIRADGLVSALLDGLQLVAINLGANENSQEIFETLNARGTPLTAADLIRNFVFQRLAAEGADTKRAYTEDWPFENRFWEAEISVGRYLVSRSSLFLNQWLISRIGEEVGPQQTFTRFKTYIEHDGNRRMTSLLPIIKQEADRYEAWTVAASDSHRQLSPVEMAVYRMKANETEVLKPLLIWLHAPERNLPEAVINGVALAAESWIMRRTMLRLSGSDLARVVADVIRIFDKTPADDLVAGVTGHLSRLEAVSTYWPGDEEIRSALSTESAYRRFRRGRLRVLLEAIENDFRSGTNQPQVPRNGYPIEHVLPQTWQDNWPVEGEVAEADRAAHIHRLGNLTLLTKSLNSKVSNGPWSTKRDGLANHDTLLLNSRLLKSVGQDDWDERRIDARTDLMITVLLHTWPVPDGHEGKVIDPHNKVQSDWIQVKHLVEAGLIAPGTILTAGPDGTWKDRYATVLADGQLSVDGRTFETPSGAGKHLKGKATNGWAFWRLPDGRKLLDVRSAFTGTKPNEKATHFDWSTLHAILEALPAGHWTTYGSLAEVIGTSPQPLGGHVAGCNQCANAHRILQSNGTVSPGFTWTDPNDLRQPMEMLEYEGLPFHNGKADKTRELTADDLAALTTG